MPSSGARDALLNSEGLWQVFVVDLGGRTVTLNADPHMMVDDLVSDLVPKLGYRGWTVIEGMLPREHRLLFGGKQLEMHRMLSDYGIQKGSTIHLVLRLSGGGI